MYKNIVWSLLDFLDRLVFSEPKEFELDESAEAWKYINRVKDAAEAKKSNQ